jgi:hypothetical protein
MDVAWIFLTQNTLSSLNHVLTKDGILSSKHFNHTVQQIMSDMTGIVFGTDTKITWKQSLVIIPIILLIIFMFSPFAPMSLRVLIAVFTIFTLFNITYHIFLPKTIPPVLLFPSAYSSISGYFIHMFVVRFAFFVKSKVGIPDGKEDEPHFLTSFKDLLITFLITTPVIFGFIWILINISKSVIPVAYMPKWPIIPGFYKLLAINIGLSFLFSTIFVFFHYGWIKRADKCYELILNVIPLILGGFVLNFSPKKV